MATILILHGPNLNLLGHREQEHYGKATLEKLDKRLKAIAINHGHETEHLQSNSESILIENIQQAPTRNISFIIMNPAAFTHTSIALRDALAAVRIPFIEVHLSNIYAREEFRHRSYFSDLAIGVIAGCGQIGYEMALNVAIDYVASDDE